MKNTALTLLSILALSSSTLANELPVFNSSKIQIGCSQQSGATGDYVEIELKKISGTNDYKGTHIIKGSRYVRIGDSLDFVSTTQISRAFGLEYSSYSGLSISLTEGNSVLRAETKIIGKTSKVGTDIGPIRLSVKSKSNAKSTLIIEDEMSLECDLILKN